MTAQNTQDLGLKHVRIVNWYVQAISKWVQRLMCGVSVRSLAHCVVGDGRDIIKGGRPGVGQPTSRVVLSGQHCHKGITGRLHGGSTRQWRSWEENIHWYSPYWIGESFNVSQQNVSQQNQHSGTYNVQRSAAILKLYKQPPHLYLHRQQYRAVLYVSCIKCNLYSR